MKGLYDHILLKGDIVHNCKVLIKLLAGHPKLVSEAYHSNLSSYEDQMSRGLQPGEYAYWKRNLKGSLQSRWKGPCQGLLISSCAAKLKGIDS